MNVDIKLLKQEHNIVKGLLTHYMFLLENVSQIKCIGTEIVFLGFYDSLEEDEKEQFGYFEGICLNDLYSNQVIYMSFSDFLYYLEEGKKIYLDDHPEDEEQINKWLEDYKKLTNLD